MLVALGRMPEIATDLRATPVSKYNYEPRIDECTTCGGEIGEGVRFERGGGCCPQCTVMYRSSPKDGPCNSDDAAALGKFVNKPRRGRGRPRKNQDFLEDAELESGDQAPARG